MIVRIKKPVTAEKIEKAERLLMKKKRKGFDAKKYAGKLKGVFGDGLEYQKAIRDEWE